MNKDLRNSKLQKSFTECGLIESPSQFLNKPPSSFSKYITLLF